MTASWFQYLRGIRQFCLPAVFAFTIKQTLPTLSWLFYLIKAWFHKTRHTVSASFAWGLSTMFLTNTLCGRSWRYRKFLALWRRTFLFPLYMLNSFRHSVLGLWHVRDIPEIIALKSCSRGCHLSQACLQILQTRFPTRWNCGSLLSMLTAQSKLAE